MGPLPSQSAETVKADKGENRARALKWVDDGKEDKEKLKTNKSNEDLVIKSEDPTKLNKIECHR
jgi:hypothetical protein